MHNTGDVSKKHGRTGACLRGWPRVAWPARLGQAWIGLAQMVQSTLFECMFPQSRVESRLCLRPFWEPG
jgi:hypothetical protein